MKDLKRQLMQRYHLQSALNRQRQTLLETEEKLPGAKYELRTARQAQTEYESSLRFFLDGLTGRREEKMEAISRQLRQAEAEQETLLRLTASLKQDCGELSRELEQLPSPEELKAAALEQVETRQLWAKLEAALCAGQLLPLLENLDAALEDYRGQLRGDRMGQIVGPEELHAIGTAHLIPARQCAPLLRRLQEALRFLEESLEPGGYLENPEGYIVSAAARHNRIDRVNRALKEVNSLRKRIKDISSRMPEDA